MKRFMIPSGAILLNSIDGGERNGEVCTVTLRETHRASFAAHFESGNLVIDECDGITPEQGLSLFDPWILEALRDQSKVVG
jgi:hypothetical protein